MSLELTKKERILRLLRHKEYSVSQIAKKTNTSISYTTILLDNLKAAGKAARRPIGNLYIWRAIKEWG